MNEQEAFDKIITHLRKQGKRAYAKCSCLYRAPDGSRCGIGWLISDSEYRKSFEGLSAMDIKDDCPSLQDLSYAFLDQMQAFHDCDPWSEGFTFEERAETKAATLGLKYSPP